MLLTENCSPPGGPYIPAPTTASQAAPTVFTTTAYVLFYLCRLSRELINTFSTPAAPTLPGTIPNCGEYYIIQAGDFCNTISLNFSITVTEFINLNPSINSGCTNLLQGYAYCVAAVNGTTISTTITQPPPSSTIVSSYLPAPTQTVTGTTKDCYIWYITQSGDSCYSIQVSNSITLDQFRSWNPYIDANCDNLFIDYAYCVSSNDPVVSSFASIPTTSGSSKASPTVSTITTSSYVPAPTQTVTGTTGDCYKWYVTKSGDGCYDIETMFGITAAQFRSWNTYLDAACDNLFLDYAYCVNSPDPVTIS